MSEKIIVNMRVYANNIIDGLIDLKNDHMKDLSPKEITALNEAVDVLLHNIGELKEP